MGPSIAGRGTVADLIRRGTRRAGSVLVTGVPRSGTTWLARLLAQAGNAALTGREPMNPHLGQYRLGGTVTAWTRLSAPTPRQRRILRRAYRGLDLRVYGRYGVRQWQAPLPRTRLIVKDPFALLSIEAIADVTGALPVLIYRHPGAVLASYRRMGWQPDIDEIEGIAEELGRPEGGVLDDDVDRLGWFWVVCHEIALEQLARLPTAVVVSHRELALGGPTTVRTLFDACGLRWSNRAADEVAGWLELKSADPGFGDRLHVMDRSPQQVEDSWRERLGPDEVFRLEERAGDVLAEMELRRLVLPP
ncbi:MAG: sulfotransferase [Nocardioidaceae bacterium]